MATAFAGIATSLEDVWKTRYFWMNLARMDLRARYRRSALGIGWSMLHPLAMTLVLCIVFTSLFNVDLRTYAPYLMTGMAIWNYIASVFSEGCLSFYRAEGYIRSHSAPLQIYPLRVVCGVMFHFLLLLLVTLILTAILLKGIAILPLLSLIPSIILLTIFGWSVAVITGLLSVYFPDVQHLTTVGLQVLFYLTPVMYPPEILANRGFANVIKYNPLGSLVTLIRDPILEGHFPSFGQSLVALGFVFGLTILASILLAKLQKYLVYHM